MINLATVSRNAGREASDSGAAVALFRRDTRCHF